MARTDIEYRRISSSSSMTTTWLLSDRDEIAEMRVFHGPKPGVGRLGKLRPPTT
jgi:hypothetical protein